MISVRPTEHGSLRVLCEVLPADPEYPRFAALLAEQGAELSREWDEEDERRHPRGAGGKWAKKGGAATKEEEEEAEEEGPEAEGVVEADPDWGTSAKLSLNGDRADIDDAHSFLFGEDAPLGAIPALVGAPGDAHVTVSSLAPRSLYVIVEHPKYKAVREIKYDRRLGGAYVKNESFELHDRGERGGGLGLEVFALQVEACRRAGVKRLRCHAAGDVATNLNGGFNGYYTWPLFGYDQAVEDFPDPIRSRIEQHFPEAASVLDVMATAEVKLSDKDMATAKRRLADVDRVLGKPARERAKITGREWWLAFGDEVESAEFDLADGSRSMERFAKHLAGKGRSLTRAEEGERRENARKGGRCEDCDASPDDVERMERLIDEEAAREVEKGGDGGKGLAEAFAELFTRLMRGRGVADAELSLATEALAGGDWHVFEGEGGWEACLALDENGYELARLHDQADFGWRPVPQGSRSRHKWVCRRGGNLRYSDAQQQPKEIGQGRATKKEAKPKPPPKPKAAPKKQGEAPHRHTQAHEALAKILGEGHEGVDFTDHEAVKERLRKSLAANEKNKRKRGAKGGEREGRPADGGGGEPAPPVAEPAAGGVEGEAERPAGEERGGDDQPAGEGPAGPETAAREPRETADFDEVNRRIDRFEKFFQARGHHEVAGWLAKFREHIDAVGPQAALDALPGEAEGGREGAVQLQSDYLDHFVGQYLSRNGIVLAPFGGARGDLPLVAADTRRENWVSRTKDFAGADFLPADSRFKDKLDESKHLPGLESSEDIDVVMGKRVTHLTDDVLARLDEQYGPGKWVVKCYDDEASGGFGVYFSERARQIRDDARNLIWSAGEAIARHGFQFDRGENGKITGVRHEGGDVYDFGTARFDETIQGEVREWCDRVTYSDFIQIARVSGGDLGEKKQDVFGSAIDNEQGMALPQGGKDPDVAEEDYREGYMVQPAFPVVGVSEEFRKQGRTIAPGEARVHVVTRPDGSVEIVPYATWIKGEKLPVVFGDESTRAMEEAVRKTVEALPAEHRSGHIYAPDVLLTEGGYKVVELNRFGMGGGSGYLRENQFVVDAYVSHLAGRQPAHAAFIRNLLTAKSKGGESGRPDAGNAGRPGGSGENAAGAAQGGREQGGASGPGGLPGVDARAKARIDPTQPGSGSSPEAVHALLSRHGVAPLPEPKNANPQNRWERPPEEQAKYNRQVLRAARGGGLFVPPEKFARVTSSPNVGGWEHDVHEDAENNRFFKFTKGGRFGGNKDLPEYLERHRVANELWPELGYKFHGITQSPFDGNPQTVVSMNRIEGTHPEQKEIDEWFSSRGWEPAWTEELGDVTEDMAPEEAEGWRRHMGIDPGAKTWVRSWRDPKSGTEIRDTSKVNFMKTAGGLVPIDVDILPGKKG